MATQAGTGPEICFQSASTSDERRSRRHTASETYPDMTPDAGRPAGAMTASSASPRRERSATRPVVGSHATPYQPAQQSVPVHVENTPRRRSSDSAARIDSSASRSAAEHAHAAGGGASKAARTTRSAAAVPGDAIACFALLWGFGGSGRQCSSVASI